MQSLDYKSVRELQEAFDAAAKGNSAFLAGGTDLLVQIKTGKKRPQSVIDLKGLRGMDGISVSKDQLSIGALTLIRAVETSPEVLKKAPLLAQAASKLGSVQVRYKATVGGNLCNASPSADTAPALLALDAQATLYGKAGKRTISLSDFFTGPGATVLGRGEMLTELKIPLTNKKQGSVYYKLSTRNAMDLAFVGVAVFLELDGSNKIAKARIALGAVSPTPIRAVSAEKLLEGNPLTSEKAKEAAQSAEASCKPITDLRASAEYRKEMVRELCQKGLMTAYRQAMGSTEGK